MVKPKPSSSTKRRAAAKKAAPVKSKTRVKKAATKALPQAPRRAKKASTKQPAEKRAKKVAAPKPAKARTSRPAPLKKAPARKPASSPKAPTAKRPPVKPSPAASSKPKATATKAASPAVPGASPRPEAPESVAAKLALLKRVPPRKPGSVICPLSGWEVMPTKSALSERTLKRLRVRLLEEREQQWHQAEELAAEAEELAQERDPGDTQFDEESGEGDTVNVERERDLLLSASARAIVEAIDRALTRMDGGTYGVCVPAGRKLSLERLEAIPYAEECVDCKARAERRR